MIKINLLPVRAVKKKETAAQQITIFFVSLVLVAAVILAMYLVKQMQIVTTKHDIATANEKINELKGKIGRIEKLRSLKGEVKKKLDVFAQLRKNKIGPAHRLAILSEITPDRLWLTGYSENGSIIKISGLSYTEDLIAGFMRNLEASSDYMEVELIVSEQIESDGTKLKRFELSCKLQTAPEPVEKAVPNAPT